MTVIRDETSLRALYGEKLGRSVTKEITALDQHCRDFIAASPYLMLSTIGPGGIDVTPRGDASGFVVVEDDRTLLLPDRPGNNRLDSLTNLLGDPRIGLIFLIPGIRETLRIRGRAEIVSDEALNARFAVNGRPAITVLRITVDIAYMHCAKSALRSGLWEPAGWLKERPIATMSEIMNAHGDRDDPIESDAAMTERYRTTLY
ncbi:MAG: pyridoxamine 5'-phosphate oxidase family protein [Rubricella sp.]